MANNEGLELMRKSLRKITLSSPQNEDPSKKCHIFVVMGASGDLAKKKIYPTLWSLYFHNLCPPNTKFIGYSRSKIDVKTIRERSAPWFSRPEEHKAKLEEFWSLNHYVAGSYDQKRDFELLNQEMERLESGSSGRNRLFYLALPPSVFASVTVFLKECCMSSKGWSRVIVEKPFGKDSASSAELSNHLSSLFTEDQLYRIDHYRRPMRDSFWMCSLAHKCILYVRMSWLRPGEYLHRSFIKLKVRRFDLFLISTEDEGQRKQMNSRSRTISNILEGIFGRRIEHCSLLKKKKILFMFLNIYLFSCLNLLIAM
uniref:Glucose-6-phosphate 1-dehydrogenase n=1 Tax=Caligus rogercresseyi TaxID=217165 RepID=C1BNY0_CALRO|nr:Glucose-6-phosphate 1-dehydrogenase [Caligus rogercresseyi]